MLNLTPFWEQIAAKEGTGPVYALVRNNFADYAGLVAVGIAFIYIGYKVMVYLSDINSKFDPFIIIKPAMMLGSIGLYHELVELLIYIPLFGLDNLIATNLPGSVTDVAFRDGLTYVYPGAGTTPGVYDVIAINPMMEVLHLLIYFAASVVAFYMQLRQLVIAAIYYMVGIFAIPFSLALGNQGALSGWFYGFVSILLWGPLLSILKMIIVTLNIPNFHTSGALAPITNAPVAIISIALQVICILTILQIPKYANILVAKGSELGGGLGDSISRTMRKKTGLV